MRLFGVSLGEGNAKVGDVYTFSLPSHATCPGASPWCLEHCYATDTNSSGLPADEPTSATLS